MAVWESARRNVQSPYSHPWLAEAIFALDKWLQRRQGVVEYSAHPQCLFRMQVGRSHRHLLLRDGTHLRRGQRIVHLHFWNEHIPPVPQCGTTIRWARQMQHGIAVSLRELAAYLAARPDLDDIAVICGDVPCGTRSQAHQLAHIMAHFGFETILEGEPARLRERLHRFGDNILISLMVLAQNSVTLRSDTLRRVRVPIYLSRRGLAERFGTAKDAVEAREAV
jgi:YkoP-like protein